MRHEDCWDKRTGAGGTVDNHQLEDFVWSTGEQSRLRALSLYLIRSIVKKHGGTVDVDLATDTININVPEEEQSDCAQEIEVQVGSLCR
jgi:sensor histidine kinase regulating citrate/malate metabolism